MDPIFHFLFNFLLSDDPLIAFGGVLPDLLYIINILLVSITLSFEKISKKIDSSLINYIKSSYKQKNDQFAPIWVLGERLHSFFIIPIAFYLLSFINQLFLSLAVGFTLHIVVDVFSHKEHGPRFFWPFKDEYIRLGFFQWRTDKRVYVTLWLIVLISIAIKFLITD